MKHIFMLVNLFNSYEINLSFHLLLKIYFYMFLYRCSNLKNKSLMQIVKQRKLFSRCVHNAVIYTFSPKLKPMLVKVIPSKHSCIDVCF